MARTSRRLAAAVLGASLSLSCVQTVHHHHFVYVEVPKLVPCKKEKSVFSKKDVLAETKGKEEKSVALGSWSVDPGFEILISEEWPNGSGLVFSKNDKQAKADHYSDPGFETYKGPTWKTESGF